MKAYKGFNKDMTCRGFQFAEGETYHEDAAKLCESGFHACENPIDCFGYYAPGQSVYHAVELDDVTDENDGEDTKRCGKTIKIGARLDVLGLCKAHFEYVKAHTTFEHTDPKLAAAGEQGSAAAGNYGSAASRGRSEVGVNGIAAARGNNVKVKGGMGAVLLVAVENDNDNNVKEWKAAVVDGEQLKPDTWYTLKNGEFVEVEK